MISLQGRTARITADDNYFFLIKMQDAARHVRVTKFQRAHAPAVELYKAHPLIFPYHVSIDYNLFLLCIILTAIA